MEQHGKTTSSFFVIVCYYSNWCMIYIFSGHQLPSLMPGVDSSTIKGKGHNKYVA
jgi:hypothetical protein